MLRDLNEAVYRSKDNEIKDLFFKNLSTKSRSALKRRASEECKFLNYCNDHGKCDNGKCVCYPGWMNYDCSLSINCLDYLQT